mmetsp:Transcript_7262/g.14130  ORF Transcript_7262/g.14130 Transcript_7262/m.14130 type:complete len:201 (-) Transcript_7262:52-654(-)
MKTFSPLSDQTQTTERWAEETTTTTTTTTTTSTKRIPTPSRIPSPRISSPRISGASLANGGSSSPVRNSPKGSSSRRSRDERKQGSASASHRSRSSLLLSNSSPLATPKSKRSPKAERKLQSNRFTKVVSPLLRKSRVRFLLSSVPSRPFSFFCIVGFRCCCCCRGVCYVLPTYHTRVCSKQQASSTLMWFFSSANRVYF